MRSRSNYECSKVFVIIGCLLLFSLNSPVLAADYVYIDSGVHDINEAIGGCLVVTSATVNLLPGSHIVALAGDGDIYALEGSIINITGCIVDGVLYIASTSTVTVYGSEFVLDGTAMDSNTIEIGNPTWVSVVHQLSGVYNDGTAFTINIDLEPQAKISLNWPQTTPEIVVFPATLSHDYGDVAIGETGTYVVQIMNVGNGDLQVNSVTLDAAGSADFTITSAPATPFTVPPNNTFGVDIEITFTPSTEAYVSTTVLIESNDAEQPLIEVQLSGTGVVISIPPEQQIGAINEFFTLSIENGTLVAYGPGNNPAKRLKAFQNMIKAASDLIEAGDYAQAVEQLESMAEKTDSEARPPDFVVGEATATINAMIEFLIADLSS